MGRPVEVMVGVMVGVEGKCRTMEYFLQGRWKRLDLYSDSNTRISNSWPT